MGDATLWNSSKAFSWLWNAPLAVREDHFHIPSTDPLDCVSALLGSCFSLIQVDFLLATYTSSIRHMTIWGFKSCHHLDPGRLSSWLWPRHSVRIWRLTECTILGVLYFYYLLLILLWGEIYGEWNKPSDPKQVWGKKRVVLCNIGFLSSSKLTCTKR